MVIWIFTTYYLSFDAFENVIHSVLVPLFWHVMSFQMYGCWRSTKNGFSKANIL